MVSVMSSMVLMATCRLITPSTARYTTPIPPLASTSFSSYRPFSLVEAGISWSDYTARIGLKGRADGPSAFSPLREVPCRNRIPCHSFPWEVPPYQSEKTYIRLCRGTTGSGEISQRLFLVNRTAETFRISALVWVLAGPYRVRGDLSSGRGPPAEPLRSLSRPACGCRIPAPRPQPAFSPPIQP